MLGLQYIKIGLYKKNKTLCTVFLHLILLANYTCPLIHTELYAMLYTINLLKLEHEQ